TRILLATGAHMATDDFPRPMTLTIGVLFILLGSVLMADRLGLVEIQSLFNYWPLVLVIFGLGLAADAFYKGPEGERGQRRSGHSMIAFWILMLMFFGVGHAERSRTAKASADGRVRLLAIMGGEEYVGTSDFAGGEMTSVMGGTML